jgi:hypothetical protein
MLRLLILTLAVVTASWGPVLAGAPPDPTTNAALKYWQAFATLPALSHDEQNRLIAECLTMPLDAQARELVSKGEYALQLMHEGAPLSRCEWGVDCEQGLFVRVPQGPAARVLSSLACLRARVRFEEGRDSEAIGDIVAAMALGRHLSREGGLIVVLLSYQIEHRMIEALALYLPKLDAPKVNDLKTRLDSLPPFATLATVLRSCEVKTLDWFVRQVKDAKDQESLLAFLSQIPYAPEGRDQSGKAAAFLKECGGTAGGVLRFAEQSRPAYTVMAEKLELPLNQFEKEFEREAKKQATNPVFKLFFPALVNCRAAQARIDVRRALLSAAQDVRVGGRETLKRHPDPSGGAPFQYTAFEGGFELRSKLKQRDDKPVTLTVGRR